MALSAAGKKRKQKSNLKRHRKIVGARIRKRSEKIRANDLKRQLKRVIRLNGEISHSLIMMQRDYKNANRNDSLAYNTLQDRGKYPKSADFIGG